MGMSVPWPQLSASGAMPDNSAALRPYPAHTLPVIPRSQSIFFFFSFFRGERKAEGGMSTCPPLQHFSALCRCGEEERGEGREGGEAQPDRWSPAPADGLVVFSPVARFHGWGSETLCFASREKILLIFFLPIEGKQQQNSPRRQPATRPHPPHTPPPPPPCPPRKGPFGFPGRGPGCVPETSRLLPRREGSEDLPGVGLSSQAPSLSMK